MGLSRRNGFPSDWALTTIHLLFENAKERREISIKLNAPLLASICFWKPRKKSFSWTIQSTFSPRLCSVQLHFRSHPHQHENPDYRQGEHLAENVSALWTTWQDLVITSSQEFFSLLKTDLISDDITRKARRYLRAALSVPRRHQKPGCPQKQLLPQLQVVLQMTILTAALQPHAIHINVAWYCKGQVKEQHSQANLLLERQKGEKQTATYLSKILHMA